VTNGPRGTFVITGIGLRCAVGQNAIHSCAAVRAGISRFREWPYLKSPAGDEETAIVAAAVVPDAGNRHWIEKMPGLLTQPLLESIWEAGLSDLLDSTDDTRWGLFLSTPSLDRPGVDPEDAAEFLEDVKEGTLFPWQPGSLTIFSRGHAGVLLALFQAMRALEEKSLDVCLVAGIDSLLEAEYLLSLHGEGRLKTEAMPAGIIPGEAAGSVVLETAEHARLRRADPLARVTDVRIGLENAPVVGDAPSRGDVLAEILREALADAPSGATGIHRIINDANGERWRFLEWAMAEARALSDLPPYRRLWHPADCFGDIGAASGVAHLCMAVRAFQRSYAAGDAILISNSSDLGERAATVVLPATSPK
jgi:3-oxoacyl-[acyl-carrier-protein] synthase I